jgi:hypothetical protein
VEGGIGVISIPGGSTAFTCRLLLTPLMPSTLRAAVSALCFSSSLRTGPARVATPLVTLTSTAVTVAAPTSDAIFAFTWASRAASFA